MVLCDSSCKIICHTLDFDNQNALRKLDEKGNIAKILNDEGSHKNPNEHPHLVAVGEKRGFNLYE